jgi:hypothetical protein
MKQFAKTLLGAAAIAAALAAPAIARPTPVTIWITLAYEIPTDGPNLPPKLVTYAFQVRSAEAAKALCASPTSLGKVAAYVRARHVNLQNTLDGESGKCVTDRSGAIKMVVGNASAGSK